MKKIGLIIILLLIIIFSLIVIVYTTQFDIFDINEYLKGPTQQQTDNEHINYLSKSLPQNAIIIKYLGNSWCYFELDGKTFLYHKSKSGNYSSYEALTQVQ